MAFCLTGKNVRTSFGTNAAALVPEAMHEEVEFQEPATGHGEESKTNALLHEVLERLEALRMARPVHRCIGSIRG